jgi:hypothetical protein
VEKNPDEEAVEKLNREVLSEARAHLVDLGDGHREAVALGRIFREKVVFYAQFF